ncbi:polyphosphate kinase 2 family protein [Microvirga sp. W0021]|uniref:Polyphosphate kinase 2 family protein n=1 Tax=Hohaiivirga grylli TaxID=3133970 RepID=A0ABV0BIK8_9HYPH
MAKDKSHKKVLEKLENFVSPYRVTSGKKFKLKNFDPNDTHKISSEDKPQAKELLARGTEWLSALQDKLYAQGKWSVLIIVQAMDAAGKDSTIKHVMSGINPQGCDVHSFKVPTKEELNHSFLWRYASKTPERGRIGIFNRSYYEDVLVVRVHPEQLGTSGIPDELITKNIWDERLEDIANFEKHLIRNGTIVLKFFLNVSPDEQKKRFLERIEKPEKNWKFSSADLKERAHWDEYQKYYEAAIKATATEEAPWYVVPANAKWYTRLIVAAAIAERLGIADIEYPKINDDQRADLKVAYDKLIGESEE